MVKLIRLYNNFNLKTEHKGSIILIGNFDGLHIEIGLTISRYT